MANETALTSTINFVPVQGIFTPDAELVTLIGPAGTPFYATPNPDQSGLHITNSTIDSTTIGATTPSTAVFASGQVIAAPTGPTDLANKQYVDYYAAGLSWKEPALVATLTNLTSLSGLLTIDGVTLVAGDTVLVKDQLTASQNGIYTASAGAWTRSIGGDVWSEYIGAIIFIIKGSQGGSAWYCTAQPGGTLGTTAINWANFSVASTYSAGTGLTLSGQVFSITNTAVTVGTYGSDSRAVTLVINAQGQITSAIDAPISIAATQISSGTIDTARLSGSYSGITGVGTLTNLTVSNPISGSVTGSAATATTATNLAGGASGSVPYQSASGATSFLAAGTNGQVLTLAAGVPSWATPTTGTVTSVSGTGTVNGLTLTGTVTSTGSLTLGGTLDLSAPPAIGGTTANTITGTTVTANTAFKGPYYDAATSAGGALRNASGTSCLQWGGGGGSNLTVDVSANLNGTNAQIDISPTGTGHVHINPAGSGSVQIAPISAGTMDNMAIGGTTPLAGTFTTLRVNSTLSLAGSTGTSGYVITSNGASAPTWQALPSTGLTITDDTTTNATRYLTFTSATSGSITGANTSSTKLTYNPSTGALGATQLNATTGVFTDSVNSPNTFGFKNRIINGGMTIDQRYAGALQTSIGNNAFIADRISYQRSGLGISAVFNSQQSTTAPTGYGNSAYLTATTGQTLGATGGAYMIYRYAIEGYNISDLLRNQSTITLSFWVNFSNSGTYSLVLTNGVDRSYGTTYSVTSTNTWQKITLTVPFNFSGGTWNYTNGTGLELRFTLDANDDVCTSTNNAWGSGNWYGASGQTHGKVTTSSTFYITGVQLEVGSQATSFDYRDYGTELILCQRYFQKTQSAYYNASQSDGYGRAYWFFKVSMRTTPTNVAGGGSAGSDNSIGTDGLNFNTSGGAAVIGTGTTSSAEL